MLVGEEHYLPYQRPPLSKGFLAGELAAERLPFRHQAFYDGHRVELRLGKAAARIHRDARRVVLEGGAEIAYDRLMLSTGAHSRKLTCPGAGLSGVHYLRGIDDVARIRDGLKPGARVVIVGGGLYRPRDRRDRPQARLRGDCARDGRSG